MKVILFVVFMNLVSPLAIAQGVLEGYGDSLTAAFLGNERNLTNPPPLKEISTTLSDLAMFLITGQNTYKEPYEYRDTAWPALLAQKISGHYGVSIRSKNFGVVGALTSQLPKQLDDLPFGTNWRTLSFVFIGHNDLDDTTVPNAEALGQKHAKELGEFFDRWDKKHYQSTMYVIPVGHVYKVYQNLKGYVWFKSPSVTYQCEDSWQKFFPYAGFFYQKMKEGKLEEFLVPRVAALQKAQNEMARGWNAKSGRNNFYYNEPKTEFSYVPENFAIDCFHLSGKGEKVIADAVFETLSL